MKRSKIAALLLAAIMLLAVLTGCGDSAWDDLNEDSVGSNGTSVSASEEYSSTEVIVGKWGARYGSLNGEGSLMDEDTVYVTVYGNGTLLFVLGDESYSGSWEKAEVDLPDGYTWGGFIEVNGIDGIALIGPADSDENCEYEMGFSIGDDMLFLMYR